MIKKISKIKQYKSFQDFSWNNFCKNRAGQEMLFQKFNVIFGENGSGKSSICDILKSLSQIQDFQDNPPVLAEIENNNNQTYKYKDKSWIPKQLDKNSFLFFDVDFINANVHTHGVRSSNLQQGAHTQKAGKLIIDLDEQANKLKVAVEKKREELETFQKSQADILGQEFTDKDKELFRTYEKKDEKYKKEQITKASEEMKKLEADLVTLQKLNDKYSEISRLASINEVVFSTSLSPEENYAELFTRQIKEKAQNDADAKIKSHFEKHKRFIESAKDQIPQNYTGEDCPLCMQPLTNASKVIEYYRAAFDQTYETAKLKFLSDIQARKSELELIKSNLNLLPAKAAAVFDALEKVKTDFEIQDIYNLYEKTEHTKKISNISISELDELLGALVSLKSIDRKPVDVAKIYEAIFKKIWEVEKSIESLNKVVVAKNKAVTDFKNKYSDQSNITNEIQEKTQKQTELRGLADFLTSDKIKHIKNQNEANANQKSRSEELKKVQKELKNYLAETIPESVINKIKAILGKFNLSFSLEHINPASNTKEYSFSFKIKDQKGNERNFKDGLSEGERQLISLAFFFAINESLPDKLNTVLIFDDPITSLDSPNLKILADLIYEKTKEFSQVIVFTHHPLFYKYLIKCENSCKFGVLKNHDVFGGSFIFFDPGFDLTTELQKCNEEIKQNANNGNLKPEEIALKYGQLLRLGVEKFIKHDLLMWNKEDNFEKEIIANLSKSKSKIQKLDDADLEVMTNIHKYCNYSNLLHADKENSSALSELMIHIDKFAQILNKTQQNS
ncbi:AAA family ATPase [Patescibacteria group bacterium]|nr:AAA family ATPase [Patescibacteria group bacterium]